jgi:hypothetical protein
VHPGGGPSRYLQIHGGIRARELVDAQQLADHLTQAGGVDPADPDGGEPAREAREVRLQAEQATSVAPHDLVHAVGEQEPAIVRRDAHRVLLDDRTIEVHEGHDVTASYGARG